MLEIVAKLALGGGLTASLLAAAWFFPLFRRYFLMAAAVSAVGTLIYAKGVNDEKALRDARERAVNEQVDGAVRDAVTSDKKDPFDDPRN